MTTPAISSIIPNIHFATDHTAGFDDIDLTGSDKNNSAFKNGVGPDSSKNGSRPGSSKGEGDSKDKDKKKEEGPMVGFFEVVCKCGDSGLQISMRK